MRKKSQHKFVFNKNIISVIDFSFKLLPTRTNTIRTMEITYIYKQLNCIVHLLVNQIVEATVFTYLAVIRNKHFTIRVNYRSSREKLYILLKLFKKYILFVLKVYILHNIKKNVFKMYVIK